jgi:hypothetical protein
MDKRTAPPWRDLPASKVARLSFVGQTTTTPASVPMEMPVTPAKPTNIPPIGLEVTPTTPVRSREGDGMDKALVLSKSMEVVCRKCGKSHDQMAKALKRLKTPFDWCENADSSKHAHLTKLARSHEHKPEWNFTEKNDGKWVDANELTIREEATLLTNYFLWISRKNRNYKHFTLSVSWPPSQMEMLRFVAMQFGAALEQASRVSYHSAVKRILSDDKKESLLEKVRKCLRHHEEVMRKSIMENWYIIEHCHQKDIYRLLQDVFVANDYTTSVVYSPALETSQVGTPPPLPPAPTPDQIKSHPNPFM